MGAITLTHAQGQLDKWLAASEAISQNQSYSIGNRSISRADATAVKEMIEYWEAKVNLLSRKTRRRTKHIVPTSC